MEGEDSYTFYFLDEEILKNLINEIKEQKIKIKEISTIGNIYKYDKDNYKGYIKYNEELLNSNFIRVSTKIQLNQEGFYFFYGFLQLQDNNDVIFICDLIDEKPTKNFNRQSFEKYLKNKRLIMSENKK